MADPARPAAGRGRSSLSLAGFHPLSELAGILRLINSARRRQLVGMLALMLISAVAELATIASVVPFLTLVASLESGSELGRQTRIVSEAANMLGMAPITLSTVALIAIALVSGALRMALVWYGQKFAFGVGQDLSTSVYARMLSQPYSYHVEHNSSETISSLQKIDIVVGLSLLPAMQAATSVIVAAAIVAVLFAVDPVTAGGAMGAFVIIYGAITFLTRKSLHANSRLIAQVLPSRVQVVQEGLGGIRDVILDRSQAVFIQVFDRLTATLRHAQTLNGFFGAAPRFVVEASGVAVIALIALYVSARPGGVTGALPMLGALALGAQRLIPLVQQIYVSWSQIAGSSATTSDVLELLRLPLPLSHVTDRVTGAVSFDGSIVLEAVTFRYPAASRDALRAVDLQIAKGERIGLIGKTGSGKSTLVDILMGLIDPTSGEMRVGGKPLDLSSKPAWQSKIAHVPQAIYLSDGSIAANIAFGTDPAAVNVDRVRDAARRADIDDFVAGLPQGYATTIGERGVRLSGGQRQRIGIARALYKGAQVLILDEATSALDDATEASVIRSIEALEGDLTIVMIAHRLSTLAECDRVLRLEDGRIVASGSFAEVVTSSGHTEGRPGGMIDHETRAGAAWLTGSGRGWVIGCRTRAR